MAAMNGCPHCKSDWKRWNDWACDECNGENSRRSYRERSATLVANLKAAAIEEMRFRAAFARIKEGAHGLS